MQSVLITGCSAGGIGSALALEFQRRGLLVFAGVRNPSKAAHLDSLGNLEIIQLDITSTEEVKVAAKRVSERTGGKLDFLVNNAAIAHGGPLLDADLDAARQMFETNVWGHLQVIQGFSDLLVTAKGSVINISSIAGELNVPWIGGSLWALGPVNTETGLYASSKLSMTLISETLRVELEPLGVRVMTVMTGVVGTNIQHTSNDFKLPEGSRYAKIEDQITARLQGKDGQKRMDAAVYARKVVGDVLAGGHGKVWRGQMASIARFISSCLPAFILVGCCPTVFAHRQDRLVSMGTGIDRL